MKKNWFCFCSKMLMVALALMVLFANLTLPVAAEGYTEEDVERIEINTAPTREYVYGDESGFGINGDEYDNYDYFLSPTDLTGLVFTVYYTDGTNKTYSYEDIDKNDCIDGYQYSLDYKGRYSEPGDVAVTFTYMGKSAEYTVVLKESPVASINVLNTVTCYSGYSAPLFYGLQIEISYNDGTSKIVTLTEENTIYKYDGYYGLHIEVGIDGYILRIFGSDISGSDFVGRYLGQKIEFDDNIVCEEEKEISSVNFNGFNRFGIGMTIDIAYADGTNEIVAIDDPLPAAGVGEYYVETEKGLLYYYIYDRHHVSETETTYDFVVRLMRQEFIISAYMDEAEQFLYVLSDDQTIKIVQHNYNSGNLVIPAEIDGYSVTEIGAYAFYDFNSEITNIQLPDSITVIEEGAFANCSNLQTINLPKEIKTISRWMFEGCTSLQNIVIPNGVTSIEYAAFMDCTGLANIEIPESVTTMGKFVFQSCSSLTSVKLPSQITEIPQGLFTRCTGLNSVIIPDAVTQIGNYAFNENEKLETVKIPIGVTEIGKGAFYDCNNLNSVNYGGTPEDWKKIKISEYNESLLIANMQYTYPVNLDSDGVKVDATTDVIDADTTLNVEVQDTGSIVISGLEKFDVKNAVVYDIYLSKDGVTVQPSGDITVSIPVPATMNAENCKVFHIDDYGKVTDMNATYKDGYMVFTTEHFSYYAIVETLDVTNNEGNDDTPVTPPPTGDSSSVILWSMLLVTIIGLVMGTAKVVSNKQAR